MDEQPIQVPEPPVTADVPATHGGPAVGQLPATGEAVELIALIDRLEGVLERSGLAELEVGSGATTIVLRSAASVSPGPIVGPGPLSAEVQDGGPAVPGAGPPEPEPSRHHAIVAPLTGIYYTAPSPDAAPYVRVGAQVVVGQVIGLIEAMKLYNEIKSDVAGRVVRLAAENGKLVKAKQALIEVEPS